MENRIGAPVLLISLKATVNWTFVAPSVPLLDANKDAEAVSLSEIVAVTTEVPSVTLIGGLEIVTSNDSEASRSTSSITATTRLTLLAPSGTDIVEGSVVKSVPAVALPPLCAISKTSGLPV